MPTEPYVVLVGVRFSNNLLSVLSYGGVIADKLMVSVGNKVLPKDHYTKFSVKDGEFGLLSKDGLRGYRLNTGNIIVYETGATPKHVFDRAEFLIESTMEELGSPNINRIGVIYGFKYNVRDLKGTSSAKYIRDNFLNINLGDGPEQTFFHISNKAQTEEGKSKGNPLDYYNTFFLAANKKLFKDIDTGEEESEGEIDAEYIYVNLDVQRYYGEKRHGVDLFRKHREHAENYRAKIYHDLMAAKGLE